MTKLGVKWSEKGWYAIKQPTSQPTNQSSEPDILPFSVGQIDLFSVKKDLYSIEICDAI